VTTSTVVLVRRDTIRVREFSIRSRQILSANVPKESSFFIEGRMDDVPRDVAIVKVHPSVKVIKEYAFCYNRQLTTVCGGEALEEIGSEGIYIL
jgi:hypothetical protein